jgi:hypothetical protein
VAVPRAKVSPVDVIIWDCREEPALWQCPRLGDLWAVEDVHAIGVLGTLSGFGFRWRVILDRDRHTYILVECLSGCT